MTAYELSYLLKSENKKDITLIITLFHLIMTNFINHVIA